MRVRIGVYTTVVACPTALAAVAPAGAPAHRRRGGCRDAHLSSSVVTAGRLPRRELRHRTDAASTRPSALEVTGIPRTWSAPVSNDTFTIGFTQSIGAGDALRTGSHSKTLTFTLSTTTP
jgi:hypothetical protein